jgi:hypothetical protein
MLSIKESESLYQRARQSSIQYCSKFNSEVKSKVLVCKSLKLIDALSCQYCVLVAKFKLPIRNYCTLSEAQQVCISSGRIEKLGFLLLGVACHLSFAPYVSVDQPDFEAD